MAVDEALFLSAQKSGALPVLRVYTWQKRCVTYGCHVPYEKVRAHVSSAFSPTNRVPLIRRPTGGGIVLHDDDLTFSLCGDARFFTGMSRVQNSYKHIHHSVVTGFQILSFFGEELVLNAGDGGMEKHGDKHSSHTQVCFREPVKHDVMLGDKKFAGGAQRRSGNYFLHQGTMQYLSGRFTFSEALSALCEGFRVVFGARFQISTLSAEEKSKVQELEETKYRAKSWNAYGRRNRSKKMESGLAEKFRVK